MGKNLSEQSREPRNSTQLRRRVWDSGQMPAKTRISCLLFPRFFRQIYFQFERTNQINPYFHRPIKRVLLVDAFNNKLLCNGKNAWLERHFQWSRNQTAIYPWVRGLLSSSKMVSAAFDRKEQHKNKSGMNGVLHRSKGTSLYRMGNTARAEIRRLRFLGQEALQRSAKVGATSGIQLAKRICGGRSWNKRN